ncbi:hypothetical protein G6702_03345 [Polynucleobacter paneuropaeus]|nr:hypothetical protein G6702_03345 [Polynucleobacter paneuropaeus]
MKTSASKIRVADKRAARLLCQAFNDAMRSGAEYKVALVKMIDGQKSQIPELKSLDSKSVLAASNLQLNVMFPHEFRKNAIQMITFLLYKHINPNLGGADRFILEAFIDEQLLPLKEWVK